MDWEKHDVIYSILKKSEIHETGIEPRNLTADYTCALYILPTAQNENCFKHKKNSPAIQVIINLPQIESNTD